MIIVIIPCSYHMYGLCVCVCVCVRAPRVRACARACVRACLLACVIDKLWLHAFLEGGGTDS